MTKTVPYHKSRPVFGALGEFRADQLGFLRQMRDTYGDIVAMNLFTQNIMVVSGPDLIQQVLVEHADKFEKSPLDHVIFERSFGMGLLRSEGEFHKRQRKLAQPAFHTKRIENYAQITTDFTSRMLDRWRDGTSFDMHEAMSRLTLFVVSKVLYDADVSKNADGIGGAVSMLNHRGEDMYRMGFAPPKWMPIRLNRRIRDSVRTLNAVMMPIIQARRASGEDKGDLLSMLLMAQDDENGSTMTDEQVRDEAVTMIAAGHETTSNALAWTWYLLATHPEAEAKLHAELDTVLGGRTPTMRDLASLKYTEWVIKESMRLYPPAWILNGRTPIEDIEIGGYPIPKGTVLFISPYVMHRDSRYFPQPDSFIPERWADDLEKHIPRYAYFPFGGGPRVCIGNSFAMMEARLILAAVASQYRLSMLPGQTVELQPLITLRPKGSLQMRVDKRTPMPDAIPDAVATPTMGR